MSNSNKVEQEETILRESQEEEDFYPLDQSSSHELNRLVEEEDDEQRLIPNAEERQSEVFDFGDNLIPLSLTETQRNPTHLEKEVTFMNGLTLIVGLMIGSGIFASPGPVAVHAGSVGMSLIVWLVCGFLACTGALTYAELGSEIPISGGEHPYLAHAYGSLPAFLFSWTAITCLKPGGNAIIAVIFAEYINRIIYHSIFGEDTSPSHDTRLWLNKIVASICIIVLSLINSYSVRLATRTQDIFTVLKLVTLAAIAVIGFIVLGKGGLTKNFEGNLFAGSSTRLSDYTLAFYSGLWAYDGWNNLNFVAGEMKNPARDLPRVIMVGLPIVIISYLLANVAYYAVLPSATILKTNTIALDFGKKIFGPVGGIFFSLCVAASCFGAANGSIFTGARLIYVAGREGYLPTVFGKVHNKWNTPTAALIMQAVLTILMIIPALFLVIMPFTRVPLESLAALGFILAGIPFWCIRVKYKGHFSVKAFMDYFVNLSEIIKEWKNQQRYFKQETMEMTSL
ncbi:1784_t:CDS:2 [Entrophospora sp. SA101]|nr:10523_t:CDS:2 [Entrophospora sp. SA101]CAJ0630441.1 1784_t:CDS:2 [Entrophospora sp. SA101]CAJ0874148.1 22208_t:CDS:2 [Entrophospora sp. SA101]CAJ0906782.1 16760_t:CDS:2 [Entrophospora sp. SA101]